MLIRKECAADYKTVYHLIKNAFERAEHRDGNEQDLVSALRGSAAFIPELSLVAEIDGEIAGHILFTEAAVGNRPILALAPLAVAPFYQKKGVGLALIRRGHEIARSLGYSYSVVLGSETYYPKAGYQPAENFGIRAPFPVPAQNFMVCRLLPDAEEICGTVQYAPEFNLG